jgi:hypothetical protein
MLSLDEYLRNRYPQTACQLGEMELYVQQCAVLLNIACPISPGSPAFWPYSFPSTGVGPRGSVSTQAMCVVAVDRLLESDFKDLANVKSLETVCDAVLDSTYKQIQSDLIDVKRACAWESSTFGKEDIFTASWLVEALSKRPTAPVKVVSRTVQVVRQVFRKAIDERFEKSLFQTLKDPNEAGPHPLPLLRALRAVELIRDCKHLKTSKAPDLLTEDCLFSAGHWFERNLHRQMSFYRFEDFRFDAAELIFCLAGALKTGAISSYDAAVLKVLEIVRDAQKRSVYWRPYRPMISTPTGLTLLPLSIEVATTLLSVLKTTSSFDEYGDTLSAYYNWLISQRVVQRPQKPNDQESWAGWHSENAYDSDGVHVWDTARVAMHLLEHRSAINDNVQTSLRRLSGFTILKPSKIPISLQDQDKEHIVPYDLGARKDARARIKSLINNKNSFSVLLYGPPGVSKTTLARAIAKEKAWELVEITPSDFISGGESAIEQRAKLVFDSISKMSEVVVFFDEIDRLLLDRDSKGYGNQDDIFQFMTPSMLSKLNELRKIKNIGFVIATNYAERIDRAIKRHGRIDKTLLCVPFNRAARVEQLRLLVNKGTSDDSTWKKSDVAVLEQVARNTTGCAWEELKLMVDKALESNNKPRASVLKILEKTPPERPIVTEESFAARLKSKDYTQKPVDEYLALLILKAESGLLDKKQIVSKLSPYRKYLTDINEDLKALAESCNLGGMLNEFEGK